jgi:hypothetical protein
MRKLALAFSLAVVAASSPAVAQSTGLQFRFVYYSDVTKSEVVGYSLVWCDGSAGGNGYPTQWYDQESYDCP